MFHFPMENIEHIVPINKYKMLKNYGVSNNLSYKYRNFLQEEIEKKKESNDFDILIEENNIKLK